MRDVLSGLSVTAGLTTREAAERLAQDGPNELSSARRTTLLKSALAVVREPMSLLLVACGVIYVFLGDVEEALMLLGFVIFIMGITLFQERKTARALDSLRDMASPRALVVRDGKRARIAGRDVVVGDVVVLAEGDRVPADATVLESSHLTGGRVAPHGRVGARPQERLGRRARGHAPWRRGSAVRLRRDPRGGGVGARSRPRG